MVQRHPQADPTAQGFSFDVRLIDSKRIQEIDDLRRECRNLLAVRRLSRKPMPNQIERHRAISLSQPDDIAAVGFGMTADSMNETRSASPSPDSITRVL